MKHLNLLALLALFLTATSCEVDYDVFDGQVDDPLENINNPLNFSDADYAVLSRELDIDQEIFMPLPKVPAHLSSPSLATELSPTQMRRALLGRVLFYDTRLSVTGETSCASCHNQQHAFGDKFNVSKGIRGAHTSRNSFPLGAVPSFATAPTNPSLPVVGYYSPPPPNDTDSEDFAKFFWDGRADNIVQQARETMSSPIEMGTDLETLAEKLRREPIYQILFRKAFRTQEISSGHIISAISDFMITMSSTNSPFDDYRDMVDAGASEAELLGEFTAEQVRGGAIFEESCAGCHSKAGRQPPVSLANNGLDMVYADKGNGAATGDQTMNGAFKTPFLRNLPYSAPYMHDGRFSTLSEVVDHYSDGILPHPNLHRRLKNEDGSPRNLRLSEADKQALVSFLEMTADRSIMTANHLSDPFRG